MESATQHSATCPQLIETGETTKSPFSQIFITLTQEEYVQFKWDANYWKGQYEQVKQKNEDLKLELESAYARIRDLKQRLFGKKTEKGVAKRDSSGRHNHTDTPRPRGQQKGSKGHGRTHRPDLPIIEEEHDIAAEDTLCSVCTKPYKLLSQTEDSNIVEIKVKSYIRRVKRKMYVPVLTHE